MIMLIGIGGLRHVKKIQVPNTITDIGNRAFYNCKSLTDVKIPNNVTHIGELAFYNCNELIIDISDSEAEIADNAFINCRGVKLASITIPETVSDIYNYFYNKRIGGINLNDAIYENIYVDENNDTFTDVNGILYNKSKTEIIRYPTEKKSKVYEISNSVITIGNGAFSNCSNLTDINIPNSVITIGNSAFSNCGNLSNINIPNSVITIENRAFDGWKPTQTINFQVNEPLYSHYTDPNKNWTGEWNDGCDANMNWGVSM